MALDDCRDENEPLIIVGYSLGGREAIRLAGWFTAFRTKKADIDLLVTFDPAQGHEWGGPMAIPQLVDPQRIGYVRTYLSDGSALAVKPSQSVGRPILNSAWKLAVGVFADPQLAYQVIAGTDHESIEKETVDYNDDQNDRNPAWWDTLEAIKAIYRRFIGTGYI
ncbi:MAG: hypothetical protein HC876_21810 [Chloroflexaceae bacterium]|nr:hypothetical protein [bacterium]NJO07937.1 hypothetical protein [Chloroflexaceae bacterium]